MYRLCTSLVLLSCLLPVSSRTPPASCNKCIPLPPDCQPDHNPPCACTTLHQPKGCILKPCSLVPTTDTICDCTLSTGSLKSRQFCFKYQCTGNPGECEFCKELPPDCTQNSYLNPPSAGGPECSCEFESSPGGCTLKTCGDGKGVPEPCVPRNGIRENSTFIWYGTTCPGNGNGIAAGITTVVKTGVYPQEWIVLLWGLVFLGVVVYCVVVVVLRLMGKIGISRFTGVVDPNTTGMYGMAAVCCLFLGGMLTCKALWLMHYK